MKLVRIAASAAVVGLAVAFTGVGRPDRADSRPAADNAHTISVSGTGSVQAAPDRAQFSLA